MQSNKAKLDKNTQDKATDLLGEAMLEVLGIRFQKIFFQDLPFRWRENPRHPVFKHVFFTKYADPWQKWCNLQLAYCDHMHESALYNLQVGIRMPIYFDIHINIHL